MPSTVDTAPSGRSSAASSQPLKPPRTVSALPTEIATSSSAEASEIVFVAIQISFFSADVASNAALSVVNASDQLVPSPAPIAPARTWTTFAGPFLPYHGGSGLVTCVSSESAGLDVTVPVRSVTLAHIDPGGM